MKNKPIYAIAVFTDAIKGTVKFSEVDNKIRTINEPPKTQVVFSKKSVVFFTPPI